jgi:hypothetical protein
MQIISALKISNGVGVCSKVYSTDLCDGNHLNSSDIKQPGQKTVDRAESLFSTEQAQIHAMVNHSS